MKIAISEFGDVGTKITLVGKLDIAGAETVDLPLATVAGIRRNIAIDISRIARTLPDAPRRLRGARRLQSPRSSSHARDWLAIQSQASEIDLN